MFKFNENNIILFTLIILCIILGTILVNYNQNKEIDEFCELFENNNTIDLPTSLTLNNVYVINGKPYNKTELKQLCEDR